MPSKLGYSLILTSTYSAQFTPFYITFSHLGRLALVWRLPSIQKSGKVILWLGRQQR
jgi:hypothetical protein